MQFFEKFKKKKPINLREALNMGDEGTLDLESRLGTTREKACEGLNRCYHCGKSLLSNGKCSDSNCFGSK